MTGCLFCSHWICQPNSCELEYNELNYNQCFYDLQTVVAQCNLDCQDLNENSCYLKCSENFIANHNNCPCQKDCSDGCPCEKYDCWIDNSEEDLNVMVFQHDGGNGKLVPLVIDVDFEEFNTITNFRFDDNTDLNGACSVYYRERFYIFGGRHQPRQVRICRIL